MLLTEEVRLQMTGRHRFPKGNLRASIPRTWDLAFCPASVNVKCSFLGHLRQL